MSIIIKCIIYEGFDIPEDERILFPERKKSGIYMNHVDLRIVVPLYNIDNILYEVPIATNTTDITNISNAKIFDLTINTTEERLYEFIRAYTLNKLRYKLSENLIYATPIIHNLIIQNKKLAETILPDEEISYNSITDKNYLYDLTRRNVRVLGNIQNGDSFLFVSNNTLKATSTGSEITLDTTKIKRSTIEDESNVINNTRSNSMYGIPITESKIDEIYPISDVTSKFYRWTPNIMKFMGELGKISALIESARSTLILLGLSNNDKINSIINEVKNEEIKIENAILNNSNTYVPSPSLDEEKTDITVEPENTSNSSQEINNDTNNNQTQSDSNTTNSKNEEDNFVDIINEVRKIIDKYNNNRSSITDTEKQFLQTALSAIETRINNIRDLYIKNGMTLPQVLMDKKYIELMSLYKKIKEILNFINHDDENNIDDIRKNGMLISKSELLSDESIRSIKNRNNRKSTDEDVGTKINNELSSNERIKKFTNSVVDKIENDIYNKSILRSKSIT